MSDFPRGWTLATNGAAALSIVLPAVPGVVHVLDAFEVVAFNALAAAVGSFVTVTSSDGVFAGIAIGYCPVSPNAANSDSGSGLDMAAGPGASLTIATSAAQSNAMLRVQGHDI